MDEFRSNPMLSTGWARLLETNMIVQTVLKVMDDNHPARLPVVGDDHKDVSPTRAAIELGATRGYSSYGLGLRYLAKPKVKFDDVGEPTYSPPPQEEGKVAQ